MSSEKAVARSLVDLAVQHGIADAVICHGSRNAPLILSLNRQKVIRCYPLADERSAAFFALGIAQRTGKPAIVNCSSGTAALNMAPAAAEAYYQRIPLVIVTADRPDEWIDQMDGQTIRQEKVFDPHVRYSTQLPSEPIDADGLWHAERSINEALDACRSPVPGPVHINVPFREPLYGTLSEEDHRSPRAFYTGKHRKSLTEDQLLELKREWEASERVMLLAGSDDPDSQRDEKLELLVREKGLLVLSETLSNTDVPSSVQHIDRTLKSIPSSEEEEFSPDLLITMGGAVISKMVKAFLRKHPPRAHWRLDPYGERIDTYQSLTRVLPVTSDELFDNLVTWGTKDLRKEYRDAWGRKEDLAQKSAEAFMEDLPWSDLKAFRSILHRIPANSELHAGNSSPVRYLQLLEPRPDLLHRGNRGTSGIDGVMSTAAGAASRSESFVTVITGDIGFFYDSNALWNPQLPSNLRVIMINNGGGGIFRIIDGPSDTEELGAFFEGTHDLHAEGIARTFGLPYYFCEDPEGLEKGLEELYGSDRASVLEVRTPRGTNDRVLKELFRHLESQNPSS